MTELDEFLAAASAVLASSEPARDPYLAEFRRRAREGGVPCQRCGSCGALRLPGARRCPECLSVEATWEVDAGTASIWSYAVYHRAFSAAFAPVVPYVVAVVELDSGPRTVTNVVGVRPDEVRVGMRGRLTAAAVDDEQGLVYFVPEEG